MLRAFHEGGQVNIEISDDGAGIATEKLKAKAIAKGIVTADHAARMSERELLNLAFAPGLSTVEQVSNISGRGVGMDVVKTNIEKIGGTVDLQSAGGKGTLLKIKIPLTLAIIPALIVTSGGERFAIPQVSLIELVRCGGPGAGHGIENIHGASVYRLRGNLLPLVYLNRELRLGSEAASGSINIVVLQAGDRQFGLVVDEINDTEEIVVKPLSKQLKSVSCFAGATIMGDGRVALILDVLGLAQMTRVVSELREQNVAKQGPKSAESAAQREAWLLFRIGKRRAHGNPAVAGLAPGGVSGHAGGALRRARGHSVSRADYASGQAGGGFGLCRRLRQRVVAGHRVLQQRAQRRPGGGRDSGHRRPIGGGAADPPGGDAEGSGGDSATSHRSAGCSRAAGSPAAGGRRRSAGMKQSSATMHLLSPEDCCSGWKWRRSRK